MTKTEINKLKSLIAKASHDELNVVRVAFNDRQKALRTTAKTGLSVGDIVSLVHRKFGGKAIGEVMKIKRTKASVRLNGLVYNVPMEMLTKEAA